MTDREAQERFQRVKRERDEARAAARAATEDMADWRDRADRYREALERIRDDFHPHPDWCGVPREEGGLKCVGCAAQDLAREALGGGDD